MKTRREGDHRHCVVPYHVDPIIILGVIKSEMSMSKLQKSRLTSSEQNVIIVALANARGQVCSLACSAELGAVAWSVYSPSIRPADGYHRQDAKDDR